MSYTTTAKTRITPKFTDGKNFEKLLEFLTEPLDDSTIDIAIIKDMKNLDTEYTFALNEIGKLLGIERPILKIGITTDGYFQFDTNGFDNLPFASEEDALDIRNATDSEYRKLLKAGARLSLFRGTIDEVVQLFNDIVNGDTYVVNGRGEFDIIVKRDLTSTEKALIEFFADKFDILCVNKNLLGTVPENTALFQFDVSGFDNSAFINEW